MSTFVFWSGVYVQVGQKSSGRFRSAGFSSYIDFNADSSKLYILKVQSFISEHIILNKQLGM